eukprot:130983_1
MAQLTLFMSIFFAFEFIRCVHSITSWETCTDLANVKLTVNSIGRDIKSSLNVDNNAVMIVTSAQCQTTSYKVALNIGPYQNVTIQYTSESSHDLQLLSHGTLRTYTMNNSYHEVSDLSAIQSVIKSYDSDIRTLLRSEQLRIGRWDKITVISAQNGYQQTQERGSHYRVTINVASYTKVMIQFFIALSLREPPPVHDLVLIDLGSYVTLQSVDIVSESHNENITLTMTVVIVSVTAAAVLAIIVCCVCYVQKNDIKLLGCPQNQKELKDELLKSADAEEV